MLDIHPAHHAANSWKEFFVHIATIALGLLIAIGLEQTVEYVHYRHLAGEARASIQRELIENVSILQGNVDITLANQQLLEKDLELLDSNSPDGQTLQSLQYSWSMKRMADAAWSAARTDGSIALIPSKEIAAANFFIPATTRWSRSSSPTSRTLIPLQSSWITPGLPANLPQRSGTNSGL